MGQTLTPPDMTYEQIENFVSKLRDELHRHRSHISSDIAQQILGASNFGRDLYAVIRERVEAMSKVIFRRVRVDRTQIPIYAVNIPDFALSFDKDVVEAMPRGEGEEVELLFITFGRDLSADELEQEVSKFALRLADPYSLAAAVGTDPLSVDGRSIATQWRNGSGQACFTMFDCYEGDSYVRVYRSDEDWPDEVWFACFRQ